MTERWAGAKRDPSRCSGWRKRAAASRSDRADMGRSMLRPYEKQRGMTEGAVLGCGKIMKRATEEAEQVVQQE